MIASPSQTRGRAAVRFAGQAIALLTLCSSVLAGIVLIVVPFATGSQTYTVLTSSMAPKYAPGTFVVIKPHDFSTLEVGDVVTYQVESGAADVVTHRIVGLTADQQGNRLLITKGDNNDAADSDPVQEVQVRGKLLYAVPYVGFIANTLGQANRALVLDIAGAALIGYGAIVISRAATRRQKTDATDSASTDDARDTPPSDQHRDTLQKKDQVPA